MTTASPRINDELPPARRPRDILDGLRFWAETTPDEVAVRFPPTGDGEYRDLTWGAWLRAIEYLAPKLLGPLNLTDVEGETTVTLLVRSSQDVLVPWLALSALGVSVQFISTLQSPNVVKELVRASGSQRILGDGSKTLKWAEKEKDLISLNLPNEWKLESLLVSCFSSTPSPRLPAPLWSKKPSSFIYAHTFGSTSTPKLCPIPLAAANMSAMEAAMGWWQEPASRRARVQLVTSLPFHLSFQSPIWQATICGIAVALPRLTASSSEACATSPFPDAAQVLDSFVRSEADALYITPSLLSTFVSLAVAEGKTKALSPLKGVCTVGAGITPSQAKQFDEAGLDIVQSFGSTETGILFLGSPFISGDIRVLQPLPYLVPFLRYETLPDSEGCPSDEVELYLLQGFPALSPSSLTFIPLPSDPTKRAYKTGDTFHCLPPSPRFGPHLVSFVGRTDDRIRLASGTPVRALLVEEAFRVALVKQIEDKGVPSSVINVAALGQGRTNLYLIVELHPAVSKNDPNLRSALTSAIQEVNNIHCARHATLKLENVLLTDESKPVEVTSKGNLMRRRIEETWREAVEQRERGGT